MDNLRLDLAAEICEAFGFTLYPARCEGCAFPLMEDVTQQLPFCWFCACDRNAAVRARATLLKAKLAERGIIVGESQHIDPKAAADAEHYGCFTFGMPL